jgi:hypothetical protein
MSRITMLKIGADGQPLPADSTEQHVAVLLPDHGLMFTATNVAENVSQAKCKKAAGACRVAGFKDWALPTSSELMLLIDHGRRRPAIDTEYFHGIANEWYWTDTPWIDSDGKPSASGAWLVSFDGGGVGSLHRGYHGFALAVRRAGQ